MARIEIYNSVSGSSFWRRFEQELRAAGHDVHNHSVLTSEDYRRPRGPAGRAWVRWQLYGGFGVKVLWSVLWTTVRDTQPRLHIVTTNPFFMPAFVALLTGWRGDRTICLLFDVYPDALMAAGWTASQSWAARSVGWITRLTLKRCTATVFLGDKIRHHVEAKYGAARRGAVIAVGANGAEFRDRPPRREAAGGTVSVLYSGLLGRMHEVDTLIAALRQAPPAGVTVRFHASGQNYARLRASVPPEHAQLLGPLEEKAWENAQLQAEVGLITLSADGASVAMPSKTYSALVAGQAIIAVCPEDSDLAELVRTHDCGWIVAPGDAAGLRRALEEAATKPDLLYARRCRAFAAGHTHYDMRPVVAHWLDLLGGLARAPDATAEKALREAQRVAGIPAKSGPRRLIIVGAGGFGSKVLATVNTINASLTEPVWQVVGFVDEDASRVGLNWDGCPIIGTPSSLPGVWGKGASFALAIGDNAVRLRIATQMEEAGFAPATIVHPSSVVAENAVLGRGVYIDGLAVIAANARIGDYALINMQAGIGHHAVLGAFCQICPGGRIGGYANLGEGSFIGTNAAVLPGKRVGARAVVGAVSMVADDVNDRESVMGIPARRFLRRGAAKSDGAAETINLLISSAGRRAELINCFRAGAARLGVRLNIIATDADTLASSACHLADKAIPVPPVRDRAFFERLKEICLEERVQIIVPTIDPELEGLAARRAEFSALGCEAIVSGEKTVAIARDKRRTAEFFAQHGIATPQTLTVTEVRVDPSRMAWPVFLKPLRGSGSAGIRICRTPAELPAGEGATDFIVQEWLRGREFTVNMYVDRAGRLVAAVPHERLEVRAGEVSKAITCKDAPLLRVAEAVAQALPDARGPLCFQCMLPADGIPRVFEINARFGGGYPLADRAGARFCEWILREHLGRPLDEKVNWKDKLVMLRYDAAIFRDA